MPVSIFNQNPQANVFANQGAPATFGGDNEIGGYVKTSPLQNMYKGFAQLSQNINRALQKAQQNQPQPTGPSIGGWAPNQPAPNDSGFNNAQPAKPQQGFQWEPGKTYKVSDYIDQENIYSDTTPCGPGYTPEGCRAKQMMSQLGQASGDGADYWNRNANVAYDPGKFGSRFYGQDSGNKRLSGINYDVDKTGLGNLGVVFSPFRPQGVDVNVNEY